MLKLGPTILLTAAAVLLAPAAGLAQTELSGQTATGAYYQIQVPDGWQPADGLVIWNHGYSLNPIGPVEDIGPLAPIQLAEGYAVAASSYSLSGWALFQTLEDNRQMVRVFEEAFGVPEQVLIYGASLGGLVTVQAVEQGGLGNVVGAYPFCGVIGGSRSWDGAFDLRMLYDYVCGDVPGAAIPGGPTGLPTWPDANFSEEGIALALNACTGIFLGPDQRTADQTSRLLQLLQLSGLPPEFLLTDMIFATAGIAELLLDPRKVGGQALGNARVDYGDAEVNAGIERVSVDAAANFRLRDNYSPSGKVGNVKIVSIHTDKDGLVLVENENEYASRVPEQSFTLGVVVEDEPTHCGFTPAELVAGWESLRAWVAGAPQPNAAQLQGVCQALEAGGQAPGPCRIDPGFEVPDLSGRVRQREVCQADASTMCLKDGRFKVQIDWADFEDRNGSGRVVAGNSDDSGLFWFFDSKNWELLVKVLDGCTENNNYWVFAAGATNVAFDLTVTDTETGVSMSYDNPLGRIAETVTDTSAFATCP